MMPFTEPGCKALLGSNLSTGSVTKAEQGLR